ncbi:MAG: hypothetical protein E6G54_10075, partial [Actinobacteria bacterium]
MGQARRGRSARRPGRRGGGRKPSVNGAAGRWLFWTPPEGSIPTLSIPSIEGVRSVHLLGIGGAGMRNLARLFVARGLTVSGSDVKDSASLTELASLGVRVHVGHDPALLGS